MTQSSSLASFVIAVILVGSSSSATTETVHSCHNGVCDNNSTSGVNNDEVSMLQVKLQSNSRAHPMIIDGVDHVVGLPKDKSPWAVIESDNTKQALGYTLLDGDCPWNNIKVLEKTSVEGCAAACDTDCDCQGFSWAKEHGGRCIPKSKACKNSEVWHNVWSFYSKIGKWPQCGFTTTTTTMVFKECSAWGDPHFTTTFTGDKMDFMGLGMFKLAATIEQDFELHGFMVPYGYVPASAFAGFAMNVGGTYVSIIGKSVSVGGVPYYGTNASLGVTISDNDETVKFVSPDKSVHFESTWKKIGTPPGYLLNFKVYINQIDIAKEGICGSSSAKQPLTCNDALFNEVERASLTKLLGPAVSDCKVSQPKEVTPEKACTDAGISYATAVSKCQKLKNNAAFFKSCIFDYCASKGDDSMVDGANEAQISQSMKPDGVQPPPPKLLGCFKDSWDRDLPFKAGRVGSWQGPEACAEMCVSYKYFGIQAAVECWCGDTYGKHGAASDCDCGNKDWKGKGFRSCLYESP